MLWHRTTQAATDQATNQIVAMQPLPKLKGGGKLREKKDVRRRNVETDRQCVCVRRERAKVYPRFRRWVGQFRMSVICKHCSICDAVLMQQSVCVRVWVCVRIVVKVPTKNLKLQTLPSKLNNNMKWQNFIFSESLKISESPQVTMETVKLCMHFLYSDTSLWLT